MTETPVDILSNTSATDKSSEEADDDHPFSRKVKPHERFTYEGRESSRHMRSGVSLMNPEVVLKYNPLYVLAGKVATTSTRAELT